MVRNEKYYCFAANSRKFIFNGDTLQIFDISEKSENMLQKPENKIKVRPNESFYLRTLVLNLINICNLQCSYCYANHGKYNNPGIKMSLDAIKQAVDLLIDSVKKNHGNKITIAFFGGEPLIAFDLIVYLVNYVSTIKPDNISVRYLITTNGTLLDYNKIEFMRKNNFLVAISIDGAENFHNVARRYTNGKGSYQDTVKLLPEALYNLPVTARITVSNHNCQIDESIYHILTLGVKRITYAPDYNMSDDSFKIFLDSLERIFKFYENAIKKGSYFDISNITDVMVAIALKRKKKTHCSAGLSYLSVSADGKLYRCPRFTDLGKFSYGELYNANRLDLQESIKRFNSSLKDNAGDRIRECSKCSFVFLCGGICYHHAFIKGGDQFTTIPRECLYRKFIFERILKLICSLSREQRRNFMLFLDHFWRGSRRR